MKTLIRVLRPCLAAGVTALLVAAPVMAQNTGTVTGAVVDATSGRILTDVQVSIPGSGFGMLTNDRGRFILVNVPAGPVTVRVELIGYGSVERTSTVTAGQALVLDFQLAQTAISLDEIIVTGVGQATARRRLGTTVDVINAQTIAQAPVTTVAQLLQGRVAGASVNATSSQPGTGSLINFRGTSSVFGPQTPVIYIDGVRVDSNVSTAAGTGGEQSSALADLLTTDIERIEITKGGAASTLYGSDAATGVIQIFTKKGTPGQTRVTFRVEQGVEVPELKYIFDMGVIFPVIVADGGAPADFLAQEFFKNGYTQNYYLNVNGGTSAVTYNVSGRVTNGTGTQPKNESTVYAMRGGVRAQVNENLTVDFSGSYTHSSYGRLFNGDAIADPLTTFEVGDALFFSGESTLQGALEVFLSPTITEEVDRFMFSTALRWKASDRLSTRLTVGIDNRSNQQRILEPIGFTPGEPTGNLNRRDRNFNTVSLDAALTYTWPSDGWFTSSITVGAQGFRDEESIINASGRTFALPGAPDIDEAAVIDAFEINTELFNGGGYIDEQIGLWDKLFIGAGVRFDAGSTFGDDVDVQVYPKLTGAYMISDEGFFQDALGSVIDELKLRGAFGKTGKFPEPFERDRSFSATSFRGESAPEFDNPGNTDLKPEVTSTIEFGADVALLNNRVGINFTYYDATTTDALFRVPEQPVTGQGTQLRNVGEISNKGIELGWNVQLLNTQSLAWSVGGTFTTVDNKVTDMGGVAPFSVDASRKRVQEGLPVGAWRVTTPRDTDGDGGFDSSRNLFICASDPLLAIDIDENGVRTPDPGCDGDEVGGPTPTKGGSFNTQITLWNRLNISAMADWATGHQVMDWGSVWSTFNAIYRRELIEGLDCSGNAPGGDPRCFPVDQTRGRRFSSFSAISAFMYDGDWFKLREISVRYLIPETFAGQFGLDRASLFGSVRNLKTWSKNVMIDPELNGLSGGGLVLGSESSITASPPRSFKMGVEVVF